MINEVIESYKRLPEPIKRILMVIGVIIGFPLMICLIPIVLLIQGIAGFIEWIWTGKTDIFDGM